MYRHIRAQGRSSGFQKHTTVRLTQAHHRGFSGRGGTLSVDAVKIQAHFSARTYSWVDWRTSLDEEDLLFFLAA
jgi:hypothetical protein